MLFNEEVVIGLNKAIEDFKRIEESIGWTEYDSENKVWDVNLADGSEYSTKSQDIAQIISSLEEIKASIIKEL